MSTTNKPLRKKIILWCALALVAGGAYAVYLATRPDVPSERKMARILADIYMADAILQETVNRGPKDKTIENLYHTVLGHYGLTKVEYDTVVAWYSRHPHKMSSVYERAIAILSEREERIKAVAALTDSIEAAVKARNDSITVTFPLPKTVTLPLAAEADSLKKHLAPNPKRYDSFAIDIDLDSLIGGHIDLKQRYTVGKAQEKATQAYARIIVSYADTTETRDSVRLETARRVTQRVVEIRSNLKPGVEAVSAKVVLFDAKGLKDMNVTMKEVALTYKPYDVEDTTNYDNLLPSLFAY